MRKATDMTGIRVGRLVALRKNGSIRNRQQWLCRCDCGAIVPSDGPYLRQALRKGAIASCGCYKLERASALGKTRLTHGFSVTDHRLYDVHRQMLRRCQNPISKDFPNYGGRGIKSATTGKI